MIFVIRYTTRTERRRRCYNAKFQEIGKHKSTPVSIDYYESNHKTSRSCLEMVPLFRFDVFLLRASCIVFVRCALCPNISPSSLFSSASGPIWVRCPISNVKESVHFQVMCGCWVVRRRDVSAYSDHVNKPRLTTDYHADGVGTLAESAYALQYNLQPFSNIS